MKRLKELERRADLETPEHDVQVKAMIAAAEEKARQILAAMRPLQSVRHVEPKPSPRLPGYAGDPPQPPNGFPCELRTPNGRQLVIHVPGEPMMPNPFTNHGRNDDEH